jgi:dienelactone hydrolase
VPSLARSFCRSAIVNSSLLLAWAFRALLLGAENLPGTQPWEMQGDTSAQMVSGISVFLDRETEESTSSRKQFWHYDFSSRDKYESSLAPNRQHLRKITGAVDPRLPVPALEYISDTRISAKVAENDSSTVFAVRWPVFEGVWAEGLWLKPKQEIQAHVIALPDADQTPEMLAGLAPGINPASQFARILANQGCEVLIPTLLNREATFSGNPKINRFTNQPHREWIYRQAFQMGRHIIGYELQKVFAGVDYFQATAPKSQKIGVAGYGEGGLLALYAAALDTRIDATLVSGYFGSRQRLWEEPIYRNVFGLLKEFGDAEIATLVMPRSLIIEYSKTPEVNGPPKPREGRTGAAPGKISPSDYRSVAAEVERARSLVNQGGAAFQKLKLIAGGENKVAEVGSEPALNELLNQLGVQPKTGLATQTLRDSREHFDSAARQQRQVTQLAEFTQQLFRDSSGQRDEFFWKHLKTSSPDALKQSAQPFKKYLWEEVIGRFANEPLALNPRSRKILEREKWTAYEVVLDVYPDVFAWGYLLLPKDIKPGERRPMVVCQHGLEGVPQDVIAEADRKEAYMYYKAFAARLAEQGFVVFAPHNPYRGGDRFRVLQRKANPLAKSLFSIILAQHEQLLRWLSQQPFVDSSRIGFYGLSYGGKTAMRVPALLDGYALSICSGDFNDWNQKLVSVDYPRSYMFTGEYEMPEWNLGPTFNHAEMAALIAPRPFMVERGHYDGVALDTWVASEYSRVRGFYTQLGLADRTQIEFFDGPHTINGLGTFAFLREHLKWPNRP